MKASFNRFVFAAVAAIAVSMTLAPLADAAERGGRGGGGGGKAAPQASGGGGARAGGGGGGNRQAAQVNNTKADARTNNTRSTSVNNVNNTNVNVNRNVNVQGNSGCCNNGWDNDYHPVATAAAVTATVAVIGSIVARPPAGCVPVNYGGMVYQQCGSTWYAPQGSQYAVVNPPY
jgi:hypothetical protein